VGIEEMVLFYGDERFPDGVFPPATNRSGAAYSGGVEVNTIAAYHVIGGSCNDYYRPSTGERFAAPGDAACGGWKETAADRAANNPGTWK
jgi:hypothetical protein